MKNIKNLLTILFIALTGYVFAQNGVNCATPIFINTLPYTQNGVNTSSFGNNYSSTDACGSVFMNGNDIVYEYTPANDTCITVGITGAVFTAGVFLVENCPDDASSSCIGNAIGSSASFTSNVSQGSTYYIIVSTDNAPGSESTPFNINVQEVDCASNLPTEQDCLGAIALCFGAQYESPNGVSYQGIGNVTNEFDISSTCFGQANGMPTGEVEVNSVWYRFTVPASGQVNFTITPSNPVDYDWVVFDVTPPNSCQTLDSAVSCNWSGLTGPTGANGLPGGQNEPPFNVVAGNSYVLLVTNYTADTTGYTIDFSQSTANIYVDDMNTVDQDICYGDSAELRALYTGPTFGTQVYSWGPTDMVMDSIGKNTFSKPLYEDSTIFVVTLTSGECELTDTLLVTTNQFENEFFVDYDSILSPVVVQFTNNSPEDVESYFWDFGNELTSDKRDPAEQLYYEPGKYTAMLVTESLTKDGFSCLDTTYREINVPEYSIPNVITPNGDGKNDKLIITGLKEETNLFIYNRWGIKVDEVFDYANDWDGGDLKDGIYFYQVTRQDGGVVEGFEGWIDIKR